MSHLFLSRNTEDGNARAGSSLLRGWPECLAPQCSRMNHTASVLACTACTGRLSADCTHAACAAGYHPYDAATQQCTKVLRVGGRSWDRSS
jgi:hypothetical protein